MFKRFQRLKPYVWRHRWAFALGLACLIITNYLEIRVTVLLGQGIDLARIDGGPLARLQNQLLVFFLLLVAGIAAGSAVARFWTRQLMISASRHVEYEFRNDFFTHLTRLSPSFYDRMRTGDIMSRATSDTEAIRMVIGPAIMYLSDTFTTLPMTIVQMIKVSPRLTLLCWLPLVLIVPLFYFFSHRIHRRSRRAQELMSDLSANIQENMSGIRVIKVCTREERQSQGFEKISGQYIDANMKLSLLQSFFIPLLSLIVGLAVLMLLWGGSYLIIHNMLTFGPLVTFYLLLMKNIWPLAALGWVMALLERGAASMVRLEEILREVPDVTPADTPNALPAAKLAAHIAARELTFTFPRAARPALRDVTLELRAGQTLGLTGPVGCGKSTLAALLARRYNPPRGTLYVDGKDILDWSVGDLRRGIGIVDQEPFLFSDSIEANIGFGLENLPADELAKRVRWAARIAQVGREIDSFPHGYETLLGERGINLSGGQRQRTALARALARQPALLILDDALAAVDANTEVAILEGLREVMENRTTILISHRISTVSLADIIVYLEDGKVAERGSHDELMELQGRYWKLAQRQRLAEEIAKTA